MASKGSQRRRKYSAKNLQSDVRERGNVSQKTTEHKHSWIAIVALVVSVLNICWNIYSLIYQNKRFDEFNAPKVLLETEKFLIFNTISTVTKDTTNWGYDAYTYHTGENNVLIPYYIQILDSAGKFLPGNFGFSLFEIERKLHKSGYFGKYVIIKFYKLVFGLKNSGKTIANDVKVKVETKLSAADSAKWSTLTNLDVGGKSLYPEEKSSISCELALRGDMRLPDTMYYKINLSFSDNNQKAEKRLYKLIWIQESNSWNESVSKNDWK